MTDSTGQKRNVTRFIWHADEVSASLTGNGLGQGTIMSAYRDGKSGQSIEGDAISKLIKEDGTVYHATSSLIPIIDLEVGPRGSFGNRFGFSFEAPTVSDPYPTDLSLASTLKCFIYRLKMFQRPADSSTAQIIYNSYSANSTDFVLKPHATDPSTNQQVSLHSVIVGNYQEEGADGTIGTQAPFQNVYIYQDNIEAVATLIAEGYTVEAKDATDAIQTFNVPGLFSLSEQVKANIYNVNILTGVDINGVPYPNVDFNNSVRYGGIRLGQDSIIYASCGDDGIPFKNGAIDRLETLRLYDEAVRDWCTATFVEENPVFDSAKYPFSTIWDSGFSMKTKTALLPAHTVLA
jgi:hypothetical protein